MQQLAIGFGLGIAGSLIAGMILAPVREGLAEVWHVLRHLVDPDGMNLTGSWTASFKEPTDNAGAKDDCEETLQLKQVGRSIVGTSKIGDPVPRAFRYKGRITHQILSATYRRTDAEKGSVSGSGVLYAKVSDDRKYI